MRVELDFAEGGRVVALPPPVPAAPPAPRRRIDRFDAVVLAAFGAVSIWILLLDLWQVVAHGRVWTGTDGVYLVDQMQYLAWIRDASHHLLASNLFVLHPTAADYFQPAVALSGGLSALGVAPWLSLLLWKPVAVGAAFFVVRRYAHRSLSGLWARRAVLVLALFFGSFSVIYGSPGIVGDMFPGFLSWGYTFGLLAVAAMLLALLVYDRARADARGASRVAWAAPALGALAASLHPWQGELLILIVIGAELVMWRGGRWVGRPALPILTVLATGGPLLYYVLLGKLDASWHLARISSKHSFSLATVLLAIAPLVIPAMLAYRGRPKSFLAAATRMWPVAALIVYISSASAVSATPLHAFDGISIPLSVLAIQGLGRIGFSRLPRARLVAALAVGALTIPATVYELSSARGMAAPSAGNANFITRGEQRALNYLAHNQQRGGVLTRFYLGTVVPAETGRRTLVGDCLWSEPDCTGRAVMAENLLQGSVDATAARAYVLGTGARFVLADCQSRQNLMSILGPIVKRVDRFGCASVYELD